jgi:16S rRNA processing protein RimM
VEVGRIVSRHGVRGEVRVRLHNPESEILRRVTRVFLRALDHAPEQTLRLLAVRRHSRWTLLRLEGIASAEQADQLIGRALCVRRDDLPPVGPHEIYYAELIGSAVRLETGEALGVVRDVFATGSNDVLVVDGPAREYLVPFIADVIVRVDAVKRVVVVHPLPGLLDP